MGNQNSTLVNPSVAGSNLTSNCSQLLAHLSQQQQSVTLPVPNQQLTSTTHNNMGLSQERNNAPSFYASNEIPMDQVNFQQETSIERLRMYADEIYRKIQQLEETPMEQVNFQQTTTAPIPTLMTQQNSVPSSGSGSSLGPRASTEIPMDQVHVQQTTTAPMLKLINVNQLMAQQSGSVSNYSPGARDYIPMDQVHVQQATTGTIPTLINVSQLMAHQPGPRPNLDPGAGNIFLEELGEQIGPVGQQNIGQPPHFNEAEQPHQGYGQNCPERMDMLRLIHISQLTAHQSGSVPNSGPEARMMFTERPNVIGGGQMSPSEPPTMMGPHFNEAEHVNCPCPLLRKEEMDRIMMECQDYIDRNRGSFDLVYPNAPGPFHQIFMMENHEQRQFLEEIQKEEELVQQEADRQKAYCVSIVEYLHSVPNLSHEDRDRFMTMCPPVSSVELNLFMRLRMEIDEVYTKIQQLEEESTQKMADLMAIKNYVMLFINDRAEFMANQTEAMQVAHLVRGVPVDAEVGDSGSEVSDFGSNAGDVGSEADNAASDVCDAASDVCDAGSEVGDVDSEAGDARSDVCDAGSEVSDARSEIGYVDSEAGDVGSDVSDPGSELSDAGSDISDAGSEDDGIKILQSFTIIGATEMDIAEIIDYVEMPTSSPYSPLYMEIPPLEDPEVILAEAAEAWAEDAEDPQDERIYWEEN